MRRIVRPLSPMVAESDAAGLLDREPVELHPDEACAHGIRDRDDAGTWCCVCNRPVADEGA